MSPAELIQHFRALAPQVRFDLLRELERLTADATNPVSDDASVPDAQQHLSLEEAAALALDDYQNDPEMTIFTVLDGEPFLDSW